jgi:outer membrane protein
MKRFGIVFLTVTLIISSVQAFSQKTDLKFGHINVQELMSMMPERDSARQELQQYNQMLQQEMQAMQQEYTQKLQNYQDNVENYSQSVRQAKEQELQDMQRRIQEFQSTAQQDFQQKQAEVLQPIMQKIEDAIKRVGQKHGYIYIFDTSAGAVVYKSDMSEDVMPLVKQELGIQ